MTKGTQKLHALNSHSDSTQWPTRNWPEHSTARFLTPSRGAEFNYLIEKAFEKEVDRDLGETHAFLAIRDGCLISERYATPFTSDSTFPSWSKAKSITHALVGIAVRDGHLNIHDRIPVPEWNDPEDPRHALTWDHLLHMSSGLDWVEEYVPGQPSDVIEMLFSGKHTDFGAYAAKKRLMHTPASHWLYSSGTTNIISRALSDILRLKGKDMEDFMFRELFAPLGMTSAKPKFDGAGSFVGSSFCYCTARDFARFGYLYLRDGVWDGNRVLPAGWVDYARTPTPTPENEALGYGAHWWLGLCGEHSFSANGFEGQYTIVLPDLDMVIVRHGKSGLDQKDAVQKWLADIANCFR